jgi:hypothetical protein
VNETNTIACLQFLPEDPNPRIKVYSRTMLLESSASIFPVESFIEKQIEDGNFERVMLPKDNEELGQNLKAEFIRIEGLGFTHLYYPFTEKLSDEELAKVIKIGIGDFLGL